MNDDDSKFALQSMQIFGLASPLQTQEMAVRAQWAIPIIAEHHGKCGRLHLQLKWPQRTSILLK
jgi:hypothetical protein